MYKTEVIMGDKTFSYITKICDVEKELNKETASLIREKMKMIETSFIEKKS